MIDLLRCKSIIILSAVLIFGCQSGSQMEQDQIGEAIEEEQLDPEFEETSDEDSIELEEQLETVDHSLEQDALMDSQGSVNVENHPEETVGLDSQPTEEVMEATTIPATQSFQYIVQPGDSLSRIAQTVYGDFGRWKSLLEANPSVKNPNLIHPGQLIEVPTADENSQSFAQDYNRQFKLESIVIKKGDTLLDLAQQVFGDARLWRQFKEENPDRIQDHSKLSIGTSLSIRVLSHVAADSP